MIKKKILIIAVICLSALLMASGCQAKPDKAKIGTPAPDFTTRNILTNKEIHLSDYKGKVTLINLWATWCPPCRGEIPSMNTFYKHYNGKVAIIAISVDEAADRDIIGFAKEYKMSFDVAHDDGSLNRKYGTGSIPTTYIVNKDGVVVDRVVGGIEWDSKEVYAYFDKLLAIKDEKTDKKAGK